MSGDVRVKAFREALLRASAARPDCRFEAQIIDQASRLFSEALGEHAAEAANYEAEARRYESTCRTYENELHDLTKALGEAQVENEKLRNETHREHHKNWPDCLSCVSAADDDLSAAAFFGQVVHALGLPDAGTTAVEIFARLAEVQPILSKYESDHQMLAVLREELERVKRRNDALDAGALPRRQRIAELEADVEHRRVELEKANAAKQRLASQVSRMREALESAHEWSAGYPLQGPASEADRHAANTVYEACQTIQEHAPSVPLTPAEERCVCSVNCDEYHAHRAPQCLGIKSECPLHGEPTK